MLKNERKKHEIGKTNMWFIEVHSSKWKKEFYSGWQYFYLCSFNLNSQEILTRQFLIVKKKQTNFAERWWYSTGSASINAKMEEFFDRSKQKFWIALQNINFWLKTISLAFLLTGFYSRFFPYPSPFSVRIFSISSTLISWII